ncbi:MAG: hypothetical protein WDO56_22990 [Gammaproteobacteria bacterium]
MTRTRRPGLIWLLAALAPTVYGDDVKSPAKQPAPAAATTAPTHAATPSAKVPASKPVTAPASATPADDEFLEFLGGLDSDNADQEWMDYLAQTDVSKVAKAKKNAPSTTEVSK